MLYIGEPEIPASDDHEGYVSGRDRGGYSDIWTDVRRCAGDAVLAYAPACECGWRGADRAPTPDGYDDARRSWFDDHFLPLTGAARSWQADDFLFA